MAVACSRWLGVGMVAGVLILRNEKLVAGNNRKRFFLGVIDEGLDTALKKVGVLILDYLPQWRFEEEINQLVQTKVRYPAELFQVVCNVGFSVKGNSHGGRE